MELTRKQEIAREINQAKKILSEIAAEKAVERWNTPVEELDLSMIGGRSAYSLMRSATRFWELNNLPSANAATWMVRDWPLVEVYVILAQCCIEIAKEAV